MKKICLVVLVFCLVYSFVPFAHADVVTSLSVPPRADSFPLALTFQGDRFVHQNQRIDYTITYGSVLDTTAPLTVVVTWDGATADDTNMLEYIWGTASKPYGVSPVIDTVHHSITWYIPTFPQNTLDQQITFALKTESFHTKNDTIPLPIIATITSGSVTTSPATVVNEYTYETIIQKTENTPATPPIISPTSTPSQPKITFTSIDLEALSQNSADIHVQTSMPTSLAILFGKNKEHLTETVQSKNVDNNYVFHLTNLQANTTYYYAIAAAGLVSDIATFHTTTTPLQAAFQANSLTISTDSTLLYNPPLTKTVLFPHISLPPDTAFQVSFFLTHPETIKKVRLLFAPKNILAATTEDNMRESMVMTEVRPGLFQVRMQTPKDNKNYNISLQISDIIGNIAVKNIAELHVSTPFTVIDKETQQPIEGARVAFFIKDQQKNTYTFIKSSILAVKNPDETQTSGIVPVVFPLGEYKAVITNIGYKDATVFFNFSDTKNSDYPLVELVKEPFNMVHMIQYTINTISDVYLQNTAVYVASLANSIRFFRLISFLTILFSFFLAYIAFVSKTHLTPKSLFHAARYSLRKNNQPYAILVVTDKEHKPLTKTQLFVLDSENQVLFSSVTAKNGICYYPKKYLGQTGIIIKPGYQKLQFTLTNEERTKQLNSAANHPSHIIVKITAGIESVFSALFEVFLLFSILLECIAIAVFGIFPAGLLLILSIVNMLVWIYFKKMY